jgi:peptide/nickel transport system ATP-binding protein
VETLFRRPLHPYTQGLLASTPMPLIESSGRPGRLREIPGVVPSLIGLGEACPFAERCSKVVARCRTARPERVAPDSTSEVFCFAT